MSLSVESLEAMYKNNYCMMESQVYSLTELDNMMPWERYIYINLYIKSTREKIELMKKQRK